MSTNAMPAEPALVDAVLRSSLTVGDLWMRYVSLGGDRTRQELQAFLGLEAGWGATDNAILKQALSFAG